MKLLRALITNYENEFKNELSEIIVNGFNSKQKKAFQFIHENSHLDESILNTKLAEELYECSPSHSTYKSFKATFTKRMLKIVNLKEGRGSELQKVTFELHEELMAINKLVGMGFRHGAKELFNKVMSRALKYQKYEIARSLSLIIIRHHIYYGTSNQQKEAVAKYEYINSICEQENEIKNIYGDLAKHKILSDKVKLRYKVLLEDLVNRLEFDSYLFHYYYYSIELLMCSDGEYEDKCYEAIDYFSNLWFKHTTHIAIFRNRLLKYRISKKDFVKSKLVLNVLMEEHRPFTYHWYLYAITYVRVLLYSEDTGEAYKWYTKIIDSRNYITLPKDHRKECEVLGMYVYLMVDAIDRISIRRVKYNLNYNKKERSKNHINFLVAELIYDIKSGKLDIDKKVNHLQKLGKDNQRIIALCKSLRTGAKYNPKVEGSFDDEIVAHERLVSLV